MGFNSRIFTMPQPDNQQRPRLAYVRIARNPISTALAFIAGAALLVAGFFFSLIVIAILLGVGAIGGTYLWWKTRTLRREMREQLQAAQQRMNPDQGGVIVEGEVIREERAPPP